jgi:PAS domain S-box-containing protein
MMPAVPRKKVKPRRRKAASAVRERPARARARLRAQVDELQRRLSTLNADAAGNSRQLLGDAARFLGAALARLQEVNAVLEGAPPRQLRREEAPRRRVAETRPGAETRFAHAFEHALTGLAVVGLDGRPLTVNPALCRMLGYSADELCRGNVLDVTHADDVGASKALIQRLQAGETNALEMEKRYLRKDGGVVWGRLAVSLVRADDGEPLYAIAQVTDISDQKRAVAALYESEQRFQGAFDDAPIGMVLASPEGRALRVNRAFCEMMGYSAEELMAMQPHELEHPDDLAASVARHASVHAGADPDGAMDLRYVHKNGRVVWGRVAVSIVRDAGGRPAHLIVKIENITEQKQTEQALRENESKFRTLAETATALIFIVQGSRGLYVNAATEALTEYTRDELLSGDWFRIIAPEFRELARLRAAARVAGESVPTRDEVKIVSKSGATHWVEFTAAPIMYRGTPAILGTAFDITERRRVSQALRKSDERFALAVAGANDGIWDWNLETNELYFSPRFKGILGYHDDEVVPTPAAILAWVHPEDADRVAAEMAAHANGETPQYTSEHRLRHRDGAYRWVLARGLVVRAPDGRAKRMAGSLTDITPRKEAEEALRASENKNKAILDASPDTFLRVRHDGTILDVKGDTSSWRTPAADTVGRNVTDFLTPELAPVAVTTIAHVVTTGDAGTYEFETPTAHGLSCFEARIVPCAADEALCSIRDITARRRAEQEARLRQAELAHVARVSTMGEMAAAIAHELNQPLMAIVGYASGCALRMESGNLDSSELLSVLRRVSQQAVRAGEIIRRLRDFVRKGTPQRSPLNLNELAREVAGLADVDARAHEVALRLELEADLPVVIGDPIQIEQVMLNLIRNGIEAMVDAVAPRILTLRTGYAGGKSVEVAVVDCGKGLPQDSEKLFEPFVSTKPKGLGLGLSISRSIVEAHGGQLAAWSDATPSTTFHFALPVARGGAR